MSTAKSPPVPQHYVDAMGTDEERAVELAERRKKIKTLKVRKAARTTVQAPALPAPDARLDLLREALMQHWPVFMASKETKVEAERLRDDVVVPAYDAAGVTTVDFTIERDGVVYEIKATCNPHPESRYGIDWGKLETLVGANVFRRFQRKTVTMVTDPDLLKAWIAEDTEKHDAIMAQALVEIPPSKPAPRYTVLSNTPKEGP